MRPGPETIDHVPIKIAPHSETPSPDPSITAVLRREMRNVLEDPKPEPRLLMLTDGSTLHLEERVGRGGFAEAWLLRRDGASDPMVGKFLHAEATTSQRLQSSVERMRTEIRILSRLELEGVPALLGHGEHEELPYLLLQRIRGVSWRELRASLPAPLPLPFLLHSCLEQAHTVGQLHSKGIVHSDLKPDNLLFGQADARGPWRSWIIDFGLARDISSSVTRITAEGQTVGTHGYLDPRHVERALERDCAGDTYALGATWYEWYSGNPLFSEEQWQRILRAHREGTLVSCETIFNEHIQRQIERCSIVQIERRLPAFEALLRDMLLYESPSHARPSMQQTMARLSALQPPILRSHHAATHEIQDFADAVHCITRLAERRKPLSSRMIGGIAGAIALSVAGILLVGSRPQEGSEATEASLVLVKPAEAAPLRPPSLSCAITEERLSIRYGEETLLQADLKTSPAWGSTLRPELSVHGIALEAQDLTALLERMKRGSSTGLPKRTYLCYCSMLEGKAGTDLLLVTPRGVIHAHGAAAAFFDHEALQGEAAQPARQHLMAWNRHGKIIDTTTRPAPQSSPEDSSKALTRANDYLRALQQRAQVRPKTSRMPTAP